MLQRGTPKVFAGRHGGAICDRLQALSDEKNLGPFCKSWTACYHQPMDRSNGYETVSKEFLVGRGSTSRSAGIGVKEVRKWARTLPRGSSVIDLGCGPGFPITVVLVEEGLQVFGVDAAPSFVAAFQRNLPGIPIVCESVLESRLFDRTFDAVLAWGLMFLLQAEDQHRLIQRFAEILVPDGRLLFTSPAKPVVWNDAMTGLESISLGTEQYRSLLGAAGISVAEEYEDVGENHYFDAFKENSGRGSPS
jgi:SAM-dependent methyltransferase